MKCPMKAEGNMELLLDYAAGRLNAGERQQMAQHIEGCPACSKFAGAQQEVWKALDDWEPAEVSLDFDRRLYARIEQRTPWWKRLMQPLNPVFRHSVPVAAAAGVVIVAGLLMFRPADMPRTPQPKAAQIESLQPEQVENALADMEMLRQFNQLVPDSAEPKM